MERQGLQGRARDAKGQQLLPESNVPLKILETPEPKAVQKLEALQPERTQQC